jgi:hypothetical protein
MTARRMPRPGAQIHVSERRGILPAVNELREACAAVAARATHVTVNEEAVPAYAAGLAGPEPLGPSPAETPGSTDEDRAAFWLTLDAINFGSGWFPTLRKRPGQSGYKTIADGLRDQFASHGPWTAQELTGLDGPGLATVFGQDPGHELMALFAVSLNDLGSHLISEHGASFAETAQAGGASAVALARHLAGWPCFADTSRYQELEVPFLKRAQIAVADLSRAGVMTFADLDRLTMFADNLVPHVLRLDGLLSFNPGLVARIDAGELIAHDSTEEVELRACAVHAVELIVAARHRTGAPVTAMDLDQCLWGRGQGARYKASPRHRSRTTAY